MMQRPAVISERNTPARPLIIDIGILSGVVISNVLFDRVIRPNFHPFMIRLYRNVYPCLVRMRSDAIYLWVTSTETIRFINQYFRTRNAHLVHTLRTLTLSLYPLLCDNIRRLHVWMLERSEVRNKSVDFASGRLRLDRHLERASFRYIPEIDECELDDCNEDGLIHAYEKSESTSDTESEVWSQVDGERDGLDIDESEALSAVSNGQSQWGTINVTSFDPRKNARSSTPVKLSFPKETLEETSQLQQSEAKVAALESQLNEMKAMIALILENQNKTLCDTSKTIIAIPNDVTPPKPAINAPAAPPPPPPPPPPMPQLQAAAAGTQVKLRVGRKFGSLSNNSNSAPAKPEVKSMADVLKGLSTVKLRPTPRSPGGTPFKRQKTLSPHDASSMIAQALKKRFARIHSPSDSEQEDDRRRSSSNKENMDGSGDDSFDNSPLLQKDPLKFKMVQKRTSLFPSAAEVDGLIPSITPEVNESGLKEDVAPGLGLKFGQHLLKRTQTHKRTSSTSGILRQSNTNVPPLGEQAQNIN